MQTYPSPKGTLKLGRLRTLFQRNEGSRQLAWWGNPQPVWIPSTNPMFWMEASISHTSHVSHFIPYCAFAPLHSASVVVVENVTRIGIAKTRSQNWNQFPLQHYLQSEVSTRIVDSFNLSLENTVVVVPQSRTHCAIFGAAESRFI